jgi:hypothetical protein
VVEICTGSVTTLALALFALNPLPVMLRSVWPPMDPMAGCTESMKMPAEKEGPTSTYSVPVVEFATTARERPQRGSLSMASRAEQGGLGVVI